MYVSTTARYLGDAAASGMPQPSAARLAELSKACTTKWKSYRHKKGKNFPHVWRAFLAANPSCRAGVAVRWGYVPSVSPCGDANQGLVIDCWNAALQKGVTLDGLGAPLTQAQLSKMSHTFRNLSHPQQVALRNPTGYYFNGTKMVRNTRPSTLGRLGQDDGSDFFDPASLDITTTPIYSSSTSTGYSSGIGPLATEPGYSPSISSPIGWNDTLPTYGPVAPGLGPATYTPASSAASPFASPFASIASAFAPLISAATGQPSVASSQLRTTQSAATQSASLIPGVPNVILYGGAGLLLLIMLTGRRR